MAVLNPVFVNGKRFHWRGTEGTAEISDLEIKNFGQVYDDAIDEGITVIGNREEVVFVVVRTCRDEFNELSHWELKSVDRRTGRVDNRFSLTIFND